MSNLREIGSFIARIVLAAAIAWSVGHFAAYSVIHRNHGQVSEFGPDNAESWMGPYSQGNAPQGGGPNGDSGMGTYQATPLSYPPSEERKNPAPPMRLMVAEGS